jgi:hypothetical protein
MIWQGGRLQLPVFFKPFRVLGFDNFCGGGFTKHGKIFHR